jgi:hypothetical protein
MIKINPGCFPLIFLGGNILSLPFDHFPLSIEKLAFGVWPQREFQLMAEKKAPIPLIIKRWSLARVQFPFRCVVPLSQRVCLGGKLHFKSSCVKGTMLPPQSAGQDEKKGTGKIPPPLPARRQLVEDPLGSG